MVSKLATMLHPSAKIKVRHYQRPGNLNNPTVATLLRKVMKMGAPKLRLLDRAE